MNAIVQSILVIITVGLAVGYLFKKFIYNPKKKSAKACGGNDCGCH